MGIKGAEGGSERSSERRRSFGGWYEVREERKGTAVGHADRMVTRPAELQ